MFNYIKKIINDLKSNQTIVFTIGGFLPAGLNLITLPIIARYISKEDLGIYAYINAFQSILIIFNSLSLNSYLLRYYYEKKKYEQSEMFGSIFIFLSIINIVSLAFTLVIFYYINPILAKSIPYNPYFILMLLIVFLEYIYIYPQIIFRVKKQAIRFVLLAFTRIAFIQIIAILLIVKYEYGIVGRFLANLGVSIFFTIILIPIIVKNCKFTFKISIIKQGLAFSLPIIPAALLSSIYVSLDKFLLLKYYSLDKLGIYYAASTIGAVILIFNQGYYKAIEQKIFSNFSKDNFIIGVQNIDQFQFIFHTVVSISIILFGEDLLTLIYGDTYLGAAAYLPYIIISTIFIGAKNIANTVLHAYKITKYDFLITLISIISYSILFILCIKYFDILGALYAIMLSSLITYLFTLFLVNRHKTINFGSMKKILLSAVLIILSYYMDIFLFPIKIAILSLLMVSTFIYLNKNSHIIPS